jgi:hypothetical protein
MSQQQQIQLPDEVVIGLTPQEAVTILGSLQSSQQTFASIVQKIQQQLVAQALPAQFQGPPPGAPAPVPPLTE